MPPLPSKKKSRTYSAKKLREFQHSKRYPQRTRVEITTDLGNKTETQILTFPAGTLPSEKSRGLESNGNWQILLNKNGLKLKFAKDSGRYFLFAKDQYIGEFSDIEIYSLARTMLESIGAFKEEIKISGQGYRSTKLYLLELKNYKNNYSNSLYKTHEKTKQKKGLWSQILGI